MAAPKGNKYNDKIKDFTILKELWEEYKEQEPIHWTESRFAAFIGVDRHTLTNWKNRKNLSKDHKLFFTMMYADIEGQNLLLLKQPFQGSNAIFMLKVQNKYVEADKAREFELREKDMKFKHLMDKKNFKFKEDNNNTDTTGTNITVNVTKDDLL